MKIKFNLKKLFSLKGFTLIELLIVIAILGILAAGVLVAINPIKRINQAKDSTIKSDIAQIANAMQVYYTAKAIGGTASYYPSVVADLVSAGELKSAPANGVVSAKAPATCTTALGTCTNIAVSAALNDPAATGNVWCWRSSTVIAAETTVALCTP